MVHKFVQCRKPSHYYSYFQLQSVHENSWFKGKRATAFLIQPAGTLPPLCAATGLEAFRPDIGLGCRHNVGTA